MSLGIAFFSQALSSAVTWNPADKNANLALSGSDLIVTKTTTDAYGTARATRGIAAAANGYFEVYISEATQSQYIMIGVGTSAMSLSASVGASATGWAYYQETGDKWTNGGNSAYGASYLANGTVIGVAFKNGKLWFAKNNTWQAGGDPAADTGEAYSGITGTIYPAVSLYRKSAPAHVISGSFKTADFTYSPPSGFAAWEA